VEGRRGRTFAHNQVALRAATIGIGTTKLYAPIPYHANKTDRAWVATTSAVPRVANSRKFSEARIAVSGIIDNAESGIAAATTEDSPVIWGAA
jgi:hypothetical protein